MGLEPDDDGVVDDRLVQPALLGECYAEILVRRRVIGREPECRFVVCDGLVEPALLGEDIPQRDVRIHVIGIVRLETERLGIVGRRALQTALPHQDVGQVEVRVRALRVEPDRLAEMGGRLLEIALARECDPQVVVRLRILGLQPQGGLILDRKSTRLNSSH